MYRAPRSGWAGRVMIPVQLDVDGLTESGGESLEKQKREKR